MAQVASWVPLVALSFGVPSLETFVIGPATAELVRYTWVSLYLLHTFACIGRLAEWRKWIVYLVAVPAWFQLCTATMKTHFATQALLVNYLERCCWVWIPVEIAWAVLEPYVLV